MGLTVHDPSWAATASCVSEAPAASVVLPGSNTSGPAMRMMKAVAEHTTIVSTNTPSDWIRPCLAGCETVAVAAAFGALPMPASFENRPRLTPLSSAARIPPAVPATAWSSPNAPSTICRTTPGTAPRFMRMIVAASRT
ncbi:hypothetical protein D3C74_338600 [compost metagenome]